MNICAHRSSCWTSSVRVRETRAHSRDDGRFLVGDTSGIPHVIEPAASGRSRCRGCGNKIAKGELRFGERLPNPYGEGEMTLWLHLRCAAYRRPEPFLATLEQKGAGVEAPAALADIARFALGHRRLPRIAGLQRAPTGQARCRCCRELIEKDTLRIPLVFYQEGMFDSAGFVHIACAPEYFGTADLLDAIRHFAPDLDATDLTEAAGLLGGQGRGPVSAPRRRRPQTADPVRPSRRGS